MLRKTRLAAGVLCLAAAPAALACGYHGALGNRPSVLHPDSVVVAAAMRKATDRGVIELEDFDAPAPRSALLYDAAQLSVERALDAQRDPSMNLWALNPRNPRIYPPLSGCLIRPRARYTLFVFGVHGIKPTGR